MTLKQREQAFVQLGLFINRHFSNQWLPKEERFHNDLIKLTAIALFIQWMVYTRKRESSFKRFSAYAGREKCC
jgi:hypothetical protein